jgi:putative spermidine/putrescine transport system permease protein
MIRKRAEPSALWLHRGILGGFGLAVPAIVLLGMFLVVPLSVLLLRSVTDPALGLENYVTLLVDPTYSRVLSNTFIVAALVTAISVLIGFPVAWLLAILPSLPARWLFGVILLSMWTNLLARTYAWMVLLQRTGVINRALMSLGLIDAPLPLINNLTGVTIGMTYVMLPFVILPLYATMRAIDPTIMQAAAICGAPPAGIFRRVLLPLALPGVGAAGLMVFAMALGYFITPALLGGGANMMVAEMIAEYVQSLLQWGLGSAAAFILLAVTLGLYAIYARAFGLTRTI